MSEHTESTDSERNGRETGLPFTRRGALAVGSALLGMGFTGERAGAVDSTSGQHVPAASPWNDDDSDGILETDQNFNGIDIGSLEVRPDETNSRIGMVPRKLMTQKDQMLYVNPSGDDDNPGTMDAPVATIQEAVNRMPLFIVHDFTISIAEGEYTDPKEQPAIHTGPFMVKGRGNFQILGQLKNTEAMYDQLAQTRPPFDGALPDPSEVHVDVGINWTGFGKLEHMRLMNIHWDFLSQFAGQAFVSNCEFRGNDLASISGKNGVVYFELSDIGDRENDKYGIWGIELEHMYFERSTISATDAALLVYNGDIYQLGQEMKIDAPKTFLMDPGSIATHGTDLYVGGENVNGSSEEAESISASDRPVY